MQEGRPGKLSELPRNEDNSRISFFIPRGTKHYMDTRKCQRRNFVPHRNTRNIDPLIWRRTYHEQLRDISRIIGRTLNDNISNPIDCDNDYIFNKISAMVFQSSSKYISPYI